MLLATVLCAAALLFVAGATPLDDYVNKPDPTYKYRDLGNPFRGDGFTSYFINMTSQTWLPPSIVSRSIWWHYMVINIPDKLTITDTAFVYITGGSNTDGLPDITSSDCLIATVMAFSTGTITATLFQIPNQPIVFFEDPSKKSRNEGAIFAYAWYHFFKDTSAPEYLPRLPMTKASVRAMDTVASFSKTKVAHSNITKFVIAGESKRGWATWTTAIVDKRVVAMVPIVDTLLNMRKNLHHHYRSLGGWTFELKDYYALNFTAYLDDPVMEKLANIVDPYSYLDRMTMPKMVISSGGDEFFLPDDSHYFWSDLRGESFRRMLPNAGHSCAGHFTSILLSVRAFYLSVLLDDVPRPVMKWTMNQTTDGGFISMTTDTKPTSVLVYHATTLQSQRRDFRLLTGIPDPSKPLPQPVFWFSKELQPQPTRDTEYVAKMNVPHEGWRAFFIEATFPGPKDSVFEFTTQVNIIPNTFYYPDCKGESCLGKLV